MLFGPVADGAKLYLENAVTFSRVTMPGDSPTLGTDLVSARLGPAGMAAGVGLVEVALVEVALGSAGVALTGLTSAGVEASLAARHWHAVYTWANHEKRVACEIAARGVEHFLPVYRSVRRWKDRRVTLELPLFPGYVFVRLAMGDRLPILQIPSVARLVGFGGHPAVLPDEEMNRLRCGLAQQLVAEPHPFLTAGRRVRVRSGPLAGMQGFVVRRRGKARLVVSVELIMRSMAVEIDEADLEAL